MKRTWILVGTLVVVAAAAAAVAAFAAREGDSASGSTAIPQATKVQLAVAGLDKLPLAPRSARVDLTAAPFSNPTEVTNPLFPIGSLHSAVLNGTVDGKPFRVETTVLPGRRIVEWPQGRHTETLVSQYVAYSGGRIKEVALDFYAQADDGSVWYFGEDVFNYEDGVIADRDGTWLAGKDGPAAMIMPGDPQVGDVYLPENIPGLVFEQVTVRPADRSLVGPRGPVEGGIVAEELHQDGAREDKVFAPGYGEFFTGSGGDVEALALAVPADELPGPVPPELQKLAAGSKRAGELKVAWQALQARQVPPRLKEPMNRALHGLARARDPFAADHAALDVAQAALDLQLQYRSPREVDRARFELWARRLEIDRRAGNEAGVVGDLAVMEWIRDRFVDMLEPVERTRLNARLVALRNGI